MRSGVFSIIDDGHGVEDEKKTLGLCKFAPHICVQVKVVHASSKACDKSPCFESSKEYDVHIGHCVVNPP